MKDKIKNIFIHPTADVSSHAKIGKGTKIWNKAQIRNKSKIGQGCIIGKNVYIDTGVIIGSRVKLQNNVSIYQGVIIEDGVFIGPHVCFTNDKIPRAINPDDTLKSVPDWEISKTLVKKGASIGANSTVLSGLTIGEFAMIGAASLVTKNIPSYVLSYGSPAGLMGYVCKCGKKLVDSCPICKTHLSDIKRRS